MIVEPLTNSAGITSGVGRHVLIESRTLLMSTSDQLLRQCLQFALAEAPGILMQSVEACLSEIQEVEARSSDSAERFRLAAAALGMRQHRARWARSIAAQWQESLDGRAPLESRPAPLSDSQFLTLVEDDAITDSMASARWLQDVLPHVESELALLDSLMSSLLGLEIVRADRNPLRPALFLDAWRELMGQSEPQMDVRIEWMRHSAKPLGLGLSELYRKINAMLQRAQVQEAGYRVRPGAPGVNTRGNPGGQLSESPGAWAGDSGSSDQELDLPSWSQLGRLRPSLEQTVFQSFIHAQETRHYAQPLSQAYYRAVDEALAEMDAAPVPRPVDEASLQEQRRLYSSIPSVDRPMREVDVGTQLSEETWGPWAAAHERSRVLLRLKQQARRGDQAMGLELVRTLVQQVARDAQLLAPVREAVVALEPSLLRLALAHPRFFNEDEHPARRLIESVAQRSFQYNDEFSTAFEDFFRPVQDAFQTLNEARTDDPAAFSAAHAKLEGIWDAQDLQVQARQDDSLHALRRAEERQALADQVAWEISQRPDVHNAPAVILDFLYDSWALVIAAAELEDPQRGDAPQGSRDPGGYRKVVSQLLWSVQKDVTLKRPVQLFEMVPGMIATLHAGLDLLGKTREETQPFFESLMRLHQPVLALRRARSRVDAGHSTSGALETDSSAMALDQLRNTVSGPVAYASFLRRATQPWFARRELEAAGFQDTLPTDHGELDTMREDARVHDSPEVERVGDAGAGIDTSAVLAGLAQGRWVDLYSHQQWLRAQLIWASARGTLFMFVSHGGRSHSMTRRSCERLVARRLLRLVDAGPVVEKAIAALAPVQARAREAEAA
jgi:hypothetical protein